MKQFEGLIRGYHRSSKAWYADSVRKENTEVTFGMYEENAGTIGEMTMEWIELGGRQCARLKAFEDSWAVLASFADLIQRMAEVDSEEIQEPDFCKMLDECGFKDLTAYESPYKPIENEEMVEISLPKSKAKELGLLN